jgi:hypothetical protein
MEFAIYPKYSMPQLPVFVELFNSRSVLSVLSAVYPEFLTPQLPVFVEVFISGPFCGVSVELAIYPEFSNFQLPVVVEFRCGSRALFNYCHLRTPFSQQEYILYLR